MRSYQMLEVIFIGWLTKPFDYEPFRTIEVDCSRTQEGRKFENEDAEGSSQFLGLYQFF